MSRPSAVSATLSLSTDIRPKILGVPLALRVRLDFNFFRCRRWVGGAAHSLGQVGRPVFRDALPLGLPAPPGGWRETGYLDDRLSRLSRPVKRISCFDVTS